MLGAYLKHCYGCRGKAFHPVSRIQSCYFWIHQYQIHALAGIELIPMESRVPRLATLYHWQPNANSHPAGLQTMRPHWIQFGLEEAGPGARGCLLGKFIGGLQLDFTESEFAFEKNKFNTNPVHFELLEW